MEKFIVSARKYRPQLFNSVIGQKHITTTLKNAIRNNTLAHAFLFCGPRGVGKTTCARILAKTINCENIQPDGEACNSCNSCVTFNAGTSLNIHELDAASNNSVDDIRDLVTQIRFAPQEGKYKIYIIDEVHMLSQNAFNAFLKTLEEPPAYAKFILATTEKHKILPTILSRCQIFEFKRITNADTVEHLEEIISTEHISAEKAALQLIAQKSEGCMRDALSLLDKIVSFTSGDVSYANTIEHLNILDEDHFFKLLQAVATQDLTSALLLYDEINRKGFEGDTVLNGFAEVLRNLMVSKDARAAVLLEVLEGMQERYIAAAKTISLSFLVSALNVLAEAEAGFRNARNKRLHVELCLIKLTYLQQAIELATDSQGKVNISKRVDRPVALRERPVSPTAPTRKQGVANTATFKDLNTSSIQSVPSTIEPKVQSVVAEPMPDLLQKAKPNPPAPQGIVPLRSGNLMANLKIQLNQKDATKEVLPRLMPDQEGVEKIWLTYATQLQENQNYIAHTSFQLSTLDVESQTITINCTSSLNQKVIEAEATSILELLKAKYNNDQITIQYRVQQEAASIDLNLEPRYLNSKERLKLMVADYPILKDWVERLNLDIAF